MQVGNWPAPYGISFVADMFSALMIVVTGLLGVGIVLYAMAAIDARRQRFGFFPLLQVLILGVSGAFLTGDFFNMYVWFEVMLIASFVLMALGSERPQLEGAIKYVTLNLVSSAWFLSATGVLYGTTGTLNMADLSRQLAGPDANSIAGVATAMMMIAFGIKAALFPLFFWLPASYHTPPVAVTAIMAGLLTKVGVYALVRLCCLIVPGDMPQVQPMLMAVAAATMVTGVLGAAAQNDIRRILSFHIISQIGYMVLGLALFTPLALAGMVFYIVHHIIVKTNLFLVAGIVNRLAGSYDLTKLGGLYRKHFWVAMLFLIPALSLAGIPPLSGFWAKLVLIRAGLEVHEYAVIAVALVVSLLTLFSMTKIWAEAFWKPSPEPAIKRPSHGSEKSIWLMVVPSVGLAATTLWISFWPQPLLAMAEIAAAQLLEPAGYVRAVLGE
jgi:multicomponent Na+:H+ antiporter subunit D